MVSLSVSFASLTLLMYLLTMNWIFLCWFFCMFCEFFLSAYPVWWQRLSRPVFMPGNGPRLFCPQDGLRCAQDGINLVRSQARFGFCCCCHYLSASQKNPSSILLRVETMCQKVFSVFFCIFCIPLHPQLSAIPACQPLNPRGYSHCLLLGARLMGVRMGSLTSCFCFQS